LTHIIVHEKVRDHAKWLEGFNRDAFHRTGSRGGVIYQIEGNPNEHYIVYDWEDKAAKDFLALAKSPEMQKVFRDAGVLEQEFTVCPTEIRFQM
jgi:quinol monooxygenase YgiN